MKKQYETPDMDITLLYGDVLTSPVSEDQQLEDDVITNSYGQTIDPNLPIQPFKRR